MPSPPVGADIESICGKCGDVWHVVAAKVGEKVMKVVCKQCGNQHRHRPPEGTVAAAGTAKTTTAARTTAPKTATASTSRARRTKAPREPDGPTVEADDSRPVRDYRPLEAYTPGDRIDHPTFGRGIVESSPGPGKVQVFFATGRRILAAARIASTLSPPPPRRPD
jgi:hypothetical protein